MDRWNECGQRVVGAAHPAAVDVSRMPGQVQEAEAAALSAHVLPGAVSVGPS